MTAPAGGAFAAEKDEPLRFPHAGIAVALPAGYERGTPEQAYGVLTASPGGAGAPRVSVRLMAVPVGADEQPATVADAMLSALRADLDFRNVERRKSVATKVAGLPGNIDLLAYACSGRECTAASAAFVREVPAGRRVCYVLSVEAAREDQASLLPTLSGMLESVELIDFAHPAALEPGELGEPVTDPKPGYSIRVPGGWCIKRRYGGVVIGQHDYLRAEGLGFDARVTVEAAGADATAKGLLEQRAAAVAEEGHRTFDVVSSGEAKLGGLDGWQVVMRPAAATTRSAGSGQAQPPAGSDLMIVHRMALGPEPLGNGPAAYSLVLVSMGATPEQAREIMDKLASGFALIPRTPATRPTE
jgi:hypothetical protein